MIESAVPSCSKENEKNIKGYCDYFEGELEEISTVESRLHQKILLVSVFDAWGHARFPNIMGNKKRFISFIKECADWQDCTRISLPLLSRSLLDSNNGDTNNLKLNVEKRLKKWAPSGSVPRLENDPEIEEMNAIANNDDEKKLVENAQHAALLYTYRNYLVHEYKEPGKGLEWPKDPEPYYHSFGESWNLVYPLEFFMKTAESLLKNLKHYLKENNLDPYSFYKFGTWHRR